MYKMHTRGLGGRIVQPYGQQTPLWSALRTVEPPPNAEATWRVLDLDAHTLSRVSASRLAELLVDLSPEISRAVWDFQRLCNPGWEVRAYRPGTQEIDAPGQRIVDAFIGTLHALYGSADVVWNRMFMAAYLRGAFLSELVLDERGRVGIDLATPDPFAVRYRKVAHPLRGAIWQLCQWQDGDLVDLADETIRYVPIDPLPGKPYGRPLVSPALFTSLFLLGLLHDLRRVVAQQGYPRIDLELQLDKILQLVRESEQMQDMDVVEAVAAITSDITSAYGALEPDDAYVHPDLVKVNRPVGTVDASSLGAVDGLIRMLERQATRAAKSTGFLMVISESSTETQSIRQWELLAASIKSLQHFAESLIEHMLRLLLEAQGSQAVPAFRFAELRASEMLRDEQVRSLNNQNTAYEYEQGWISQDEAAQKAVGHAPDQPTPRVTGVTEGATLPDVPLASEDARHLFADVQRERARLERLLHEGDGDAQE